MPPTQFPSNQNNMFIRNPNVQSITPNNSAGLPSTPGFVPNSSKNLGTAFPFSTRGTNSQGVSQNLQVGFVASNTAGEASNSTLKTTRLAEVDSKNSYSLCSGSSTPNSAASTANAFIRPSSAASSIKNLITPKFTILPEQRGRGRKRKKVYIL